MGPDRQLRRAPVVEYGVTTRIGVSRWLYFDLIRPYERAVLVSAYWIPQSESDAEEVAREAIL